MAIGLIGGLIGGAAEGLGVGASKAAGKWMEHEFAKERDAILENRRESMARLVSTLRREDAMYEATNVDPIRQATAVETATKTAQARIDVETDPANVDKAIEKLNKLDPAEAKVKREALIADLEAKATPEALAAARKVAQATHIESAASIAQADLARLSIKDRERVQKLQDEYLAPDTSPQRKEQINTELNVLTGKREDVIKMRVKVGEDATGQPIMEDVLVDPKTKKRIDTSGGGGGGAPQSGAPTAGTIVNGFKFKGGNPRERGNWEPVNPVFGGAGGFTPDTGKTDITKPAPVRAAPITNLNEWVREKSGSFGGYRYKHLRTGETISESEFESRTR